MEVTRVSQLLTKEDGEPVLCVRATVKSVFGIKTGIGRDKNGSVQNLTLTDGKNEIKAGFWDCPEFGRDWKGAEIVITAQKNDKNQWAGIAVVDDNYEGKTSKNLRVKSQALIERADQPARGAAPSAPSAPARAPAPRPAPTGRPQFWVMKDGATEPLLIQEQELIALAAQGFEGPVMKEGETRWNDAKHYGYTAAAQEPERPPAPAVQHEAAQPDDWLERSRCVLAAKHVARHGNAMKLCIARMMAVADWFQAKYGRPMPDAAVLSMATSLYISMKPDFGRDGTPKTGIIDGLPDSRDIADILKSIAAEPAGQPE